jgi:hypothetical protein
MKVLLVILVLFFAPQVMAKKQKGPCEHPILIELQAKHINQMTPQEYDYFKTASQKCEEYTKEKKFNPGKFWLWTGIIVLTIGVINAASMSN